MADIYNYTFSGQLANRTTGEPAPISGTFSVNYSIGSIVESSISFNGVNFTSGRLEIYRNSDGSASYGADFGNMPSSNELNNLRFRYDDQLENAITNVTYVKTFTDYSSGTPTTTFTEFVAASVPATTSVTCFATGTRIRTARGDVAIEDLRVGDVALTVGGGSRPIRWIGSRHLDGRGRALPFNQGPVRIRAGAFGPGLPARDLFLSPGHPVLVGAGADGQGGVLVPVMCLINGTSIAREPATSVTYWHVELDAHDILLAEGLAAESYLDWGDRPFFTEASDHALHNPDFVVPGLIARCRPVAVDGPAVEAERARLSTLFAASLGEACAWDEAERFGWLVA